MTTNPPEALPASYSYGRVVARFIKAVGDSLSDEDDVPEVVPSAGTVTFTPTETDRLISDLTAQPSVHISHETITATLDSEGYLSRNGNRWLKLWTGEWTVSFQIPGFSRAPFPVLITTEHTAETPLDLLLATPYEPPTGATVTTLLVPANPLPNSTLTLDPETGKLVWTALSQISGPSAYDVAVSNGFVGTESEWLQSLVGPQGDASTVPGPSAYSVAVANGFVGSEAEWLQSLVGPQGDASTVPGPSGRGITSIADPDLDGVATVTYSDATTSTLPLPAGPAGTTSWAGITDKPTIPDSPDDVGAAPAVQPINAQTGAYTLTASDAGKLVTVTAATAVDVTVPSGVFTAGQRVDVLDLGAERVTFVAGVDMTLNGTPSLVSRAQYSAHSVVFLSSTEAVVVGDLA